ncbi:Prostaglandin reductase 1, partial [Armadillidium vulgare]
TGCTVIAFAGSEEKISWLKNELHLDHVFNYKTTNISEKIKECAPRGIDCYLKMLEENFLQKLFPTWHPTEELQFVELFPDIQMMIFIR